MKTLIGKKSHKMKWLFGILAVLLAIPAINYCYTRYMRGEIRLPKNLITYEQMKVIGSNPEKLETIGFFKRGVEENFCYVSKGEELNWGVDGVIVYPNPTQEMIDQESIWISIFTDGYHAHIEEIKAMDPVQLPIVETYFERFFVSPRYWLKPEYNTSLGNVNIYSSDCVIVIRADADSKHYVKVIQDLLSVYEQ